MENLEQENYFIVINEKGYKEEDLDESQKVLAIELNAIARDMIQLEAQWNKLNRDKTYRLQEFHKNEDKSEENKDD